MVLPVRNAATVIGEQVDALSGQDYGGAWELVVVDDGSTDGSWELLTERLGGCPRVRLVRLGAPAPNGASAARNLGAKVAGGELLAFCDADDVVWPGWIRALVSGASNGDVVAPEFDVCLLNDPVVRQWHGTPPSPRHHPLSAFLPAASSGGCAVWADAFAAIGGFDEEHPGAEDKDFSWRLQLAGYRLHVAPGAIVSYRYRATMRETARQEFEWGKAHARLFRHYRAVGMRRTSLVYALGSWARMVLGIPLLPWVTWQRGRWVVRAARLSGRMVGSLRERVFFP